MLNITETFAGASRHVGVFQDARLGLDSAQESLDGGGGLRVREPRGRGCAMALATSKHCFSCTRVGCH